MDRRGLLQATAMCLALALRPDQACARSQFETGETTPLKASISLDFTIIIPSFVSLLAGDGKDAGDVLGLPRITANGGTLSITAKAPATDSAFPASSVTLLGPGGAQWEIDREMVRDIDNPRIYIASP